MGSKLNLVHFKQKNLASGENNFGDIHEKTILTKFGAETLETFYSSPNVSLRTSFCAINSRIMLLVCLIGLSCFTRC